MVNQAPKASLPRQLALRFISGKYQGGEFPLTSGKEIVVGRASDLDMVLVEDMVSRRHARIEHDGTQILIEDLGSTNGTFVNGEKIRRAALKEGDRVLIGTSILKMVAFDAAAARPMRRRTEEVAASGQTKSMTGSIEEIPLPDLLQLLGSSKKGGILVVRSEDDVGRIYLRKGLVYWASINDLDDVPPLKCVFRILTWTRGGFELEPGEDRTMPGEINASVQELLMEGLRQIDELNAIRHRLPDLDARLVVPQPLRAALRDLGPKELDVLQLAHNHGELALVLDRSPLMDLETATTLLKLLQAGFLRADRPA